MYSYRQEYHGWYRWIQWWECQGINDVSWLLLYAVVGDHELGATVTLVPSEPAPVWELEVGDDVDEQEEEAEGKGEGEMIATITEMSS